VIENLLDHYRVLDAGDDPDRAFAFLAFIDVDIEHPQGYERYSIA
jgi:hypothetical protein